MPKSTYTVKEVAGMLGFSTNTVYKYLENGSIKSVRLGLEGRFRIPANEVDRLLHERGKKLSDFDADHLTTPTNFPSIFDWMIAFMSIGIGFSQFVNPVYINSLATISTLVPFINTICILLIVGGIFLLGFDMFRLKENSTIPALKVGIGILYLILGGVFLSRGSVVAVGYLSLSLTLVISAFKRIQSYYQFLIFVNILCLLIGIFYVVHPESFGPFNPARFVSISKDVFSISWILFFGIFLFTSYKAYQKNTIFIWVTNSLVGVISYIYAIVAFANGFWGSAVFGIILGTFSFLFPVVGESSFFQTAKQKESRICFFWLLGAFIAGSFILRMVNISFQRTILSGMEKEAETAAIITKNFIDSNISKLEASQEPGHLALYLDNEENIPISYFDEELKQIFVMSDSSFARIIVVNNKGKIIDTYPYYLRSQDAYISDREYFTNPASTGDVYVSGLVQPRFPGINPSILISPPVTREDGRFMGVVIASVNLIELQKQIEKITPKSRLLTITDSENYYIISSGIQSAVVTVFEEDFQDPSTINTELAVGYNDEGVLEFRASKKVDGYDWNVQITQPQSAAMKSFSLIGFGVFMFFIVFTVGTLVFIMFLKRSK